MTTHYLDGEVFGVDNRIDYWYLDPNSCVIKYAGKFDDFDEVDTYLDEHGIDSVWIFTGRPVVEEIQ